MVDDLLSLIVDTLISSGLYCDFITLYKFDVYKDVKLATVEIVYIDGVAMLLFDADSNSRCVPLCSPVVPQLLSTLTAVNCRYDPLL